MRIHTGVDQGSLEWMLLRAGKVTASEADALISPLGKIRTGEGVETYLNQKLVELWTGGPLPQLQGIFDMDQGKILEERARPAFTIHTGLEVSTAAFVETDDGKSGCSPDAMVGEFAGVEIKCPTMPKHVGYLRAGKLPADYVAQVQFSLWVTGFSHWHFFSYNRAFPPLHLIIEQDEKFQDSLTEAVESFLEKLESEMKRIEVMNGGPPKRSVPPPPPPPKDDGTTLDGIPFTPGV
jgi:exodeoxyribonuclease (lambda-induced)